MTLEDLQSDPGNPQTFDSSTRTLLEVSPVGVVILDRIEAKLLYANPAMLKIMQVKTIDDLRNIKPGDSWADKDLFAKIRQIISTGTSVSNMEAERNRPNGSSWWSMVSIQPIVFDGQQASILWETDISATKEAEKRSAESEYRLQSIFDASPIAVGITREEDSTIAYANNSYATMFGYTPDEILGHKAINLWANPDDRGRFIEKFREQGEIIQAEALGRCKNGDEIWVSLSWKSFNFKGDPCHIFWFTNINQQKETEFALARAKEQAEVATKAKSDFLAAMSHEIRTPLNGVLGLAELLKKSDLDADQARKVKAILSSGQALLTILNDVLDMSRIESGNLDLEETSFELQDFLSNLCLPFSEEAAAKNVAFHIQSNIDEDLILKGDMTRLRQILWNLLGNAVKFTSQGEISLAITQTPRPPVLQQTQISFRVRDTGCGIPEDRLESIFDAFTQADSTISRKYGGSGLGLTIVSRLVQMMGGDIAVSSDEGGSTFEVVIPFKTQAELDPEPAAFVPASDCGCHFKILMAEDNMVNAMIARAILEDAGHEVRHALNGVQAVNLAAEGWADVILMDIRMPEMDGLEATKIIRETDTGQDIPIIAVTAEAFKDKHAIIEENGIKDILTKPFSAQQLLQTIEKHCV